MKAALKTTTLIMLAREGNIEAKSELAGAYFKGNESAGSKDTIMKYLCDAANAGDWRSCVLLGNVKMKTKGTTPLDIYQCMKPALDAKHPYAMNTYADYLFNFNTKESLIEASDILAECASMNTDGRSDLDRSSIAEAQLCMSNMMKLSRYRKTLQKYFGKDVELGYQASLKWLNLAAANGNDAATREMLQSNNIPDIIKNMIDIIRQIPVKYHYLLQTCIGKEEKAPPLQVFIQTDGSILITQDDNIWRPAFSTWETAAYLFFIRHPEGIYLENIGDYADEICSLYYCLKHADDDEEILFTYVMEHLPWKEKLAMPEKTTAAVNSTRQQNKERLKREAAEENRISQVNKANEKIQNMAKDLIDRGGLFSGYIASINKKLRQLGEDKDIPNIEDLEIHGEKEFTEKDGVKLNRAYKWVSISDNLLYFNRGIFSDDDFFCEVDRRDYDKIPFTFDKEIFKRAADEFDDGWAQYYMGHYWSEMAETPDYDQSYMYYSKAAEKNISKAIKRLGDLTVDGNGTEQDIDRAIELYVKAGRGMPEAFGEAAFVMNYYYKDVRYGLKYATRAAMTGNKTYIKDLTGMCNSINKRRTTPQQLVRIIHLAIRGDKPSMDVLCELAHEECSDLNPEAWQKAYRQACKMTPAQIDIAFSLLSDGQDDDASGNEIQKLTVTDNKDIEITFTDGSTILPLSPKGKALYIYLLMTNNGISDKYAEDTTSDQYKEQLLYKLYSYFKKKINRYGDLEGDKCRDFAQKCLPRQDIRLKNDRELTLTVSDVNKMVTNTVFDDDLCKRLMITTDSEGRRNIDIPREKLDLDSFA